MKKKEKATDIREDYLEIFGRGEHCQWDKNMPKGKDNKGKPKGKLVKGKGKHQGKKRKAGGQKTTHSHIDAVDTRAIRMEDHMQ